MLTLEQCRRIDPDLANLPDEELLALRDKLYAVANVALDSLGPSRSLKSGSRASPSPRRRQSCLTDVYV